MPESEELQQVFRYAADTLGQRVLSNRQLVWKPSKKDEILTQIRAAKMMVSMEHSRATGWQAARPGAAAATGRRPGPGVGLGAHRTPPAPPPQPATRPRANAMVGGVPPRVAGPAIGPQRGLFGDVGMAAMRMGTVMEAASMLTEGTVGGADLFLDPEAFQVGTMATGWQPEASPAIKASIGGIVDMLRKSGLFDGASIDLGKEIAGEIATCLPVIGAVLTLSQAAMQTVDLCVDRYRVWTLNKNSVHITPGQPMAALQAVRSLYNRHSVEMATRAATNWTAGGLAVGGLFADMGAVSGPLVGIIKAVVNLVITIVNSCITLREMRIANKVLARGGPFDAALLAKSPILGTYLLTEAESSTLYAFLVAGPLPKHWMDEVQRLMPHIQAVVLCANALQVRSPFQLDRPEVDANGNKVVSFAKGDHFLNPASYRTAQRVAHEAALIARRDPKALQFFKQHLNVTGHSLLGGRSVPGVPAPGTPPKVAGHTLPGAVKLPGMKP